MSEFILSVCGIIVCSIVTMLWIFQNFMKKDFKPNTLKSKTPTFDTAEYPTFTFSTRSRNIIPTLLKHVQKLKQNNPITRRHNICIFGPGCVKEGTVRFSPEYMELTAILYDFRVDFVVIDKDIETLAIIKTNHIYYLPDHYKPYLSSIHNNKDDLKHELIQRIMDVSHGNEREWNQRVFDFTEVNHTLTTIQSDFIDVFANDSIKDGLLFDIIIANNCLFFAFNDPKLNENNAKFLYLRNILSKLNKDGIMFMCRHNAIFAWISNEAFGMEKLYHSEEHGIMMMII
eukprot:480274_1